MRYIFAAKRSEYNQQFDCDSSKEDEVHAPRGGATSGGRSVEQEEKESACKPGSVEDNHSSGTYVAIRLKRPTRELRGPRIVPLFGLAPSGVFRATECYHQRGALLPHLFTLTRLSKKDVGGIFSVALSVDSRLPGVTWHSAQWSPDFPPCCNTSVKHSDCPADSWHDYKCLR